MGRAPPSPCSLCPSVPRLSVQAAATQAWASHCTRPHPPAHQTPAPPHSHPAVREDGVRKVDPDPQHPWQGPWRGLAGLGRKGRRPYAFHLSLGEDAGEHDHAERHCEDEDEGEGQGGCCGHDGPEQGQAEQLQGCEQVHTEGPNLGQVGWDKTGEPRLLPSLRAPVPGGPSGPATFRGWMTLSSPRGGDGNAFLCAYQRQVCTDRMVATNGGR